MTPFDIKAVKLILQATHNCKFTPAITLQHEIYLNFIALKFYKEKFKLSEA